MKTAIYAGSFDPLTNGHIWVISEATQMFDHVIITISHNPEKKSLMTLSDKEEMIKSLNFKNVEIKVLPKDYVASFAKSVEAEYLVRGIRNATDLDYEKTVMTMNHQINKDLKTVFLVPPASLCHVSSSLVKSLIGFPGWQKVVGELVPHVTLQKLNRTVHKDILKKQWNTLSSQSSFHAHKSDQWFENLMDRFSEPQRFYHNLNHIMELLEKFSKIPSQTRLEEDIILFSIWFHDSVYDPQKSDNEEKSLELWLEYCKDLNIDEVIKNRVSKNIMATKNHIATNDPESNLFLDLDLSILASDPERFEQYDLEISREYAWVPAKAYQQGRRKILEEFYNSPRLFKTKWGMGLETKAKENLATKIK